MKKKTYCFVGASCTSMTCCTEDTEMDTTFTWFLDVDSCNLKFTVGIENKKEETLLQDFNFGKITIFIVMLLRPWLEITKTDLITPFYPSVMPYFHHHRFWHIFFDMNLNTEVTVSMLLFCQKIQKYMCFDLAGLIVTCSLFVICTTLCVLHTVTFSYFFNFF